MMFRRSKILVMVCVLLTGVVATSEARLWKPNGADAAREYVIVEHSLSDSEYVFIYWLAREVVGDVGEDPSLEEFFTDYLMIGVGHINITAMGTFAFTEPVGVLLEAENAGSRQPLAKDALPPLVVAMEEGVGSVLAAGMGQFGAAIEWFFFPAEGLDSCEPGRFWIVYGEEKYEYVTPIPGCAETEAQ